MTPDVTTLDLVSLVHSIDERIDQQLAQSPQVPLLPGTPRPANLERFIQFSLDTHSFALPIAHVLETGHLPAVTPLPGLHPAISGLMSFRGEVIPLVSLATLLALPVPPSHARFLIVRTPSSFGPCALAVDRVSGLLSLPPHHIEPSSEPHLLGRATRHGHPVRILALDTLFPLLANSGQPTESEITV